MQSPVCAVDAPAKLTAKQSTTVTRNGALEIYLEANEAVLGGSFNLVYDPSVMSFNYVSYGTLTYTYQINSSYATNKVRVTFASSSGIMHLLSSYFARSPLK